MTTMHRRPLELAAAAIDFELSAHERDELDRHLEGCSLCRSRIAGLRQDAHTIEALPILPVTADQSARLRAANLRRPERRAASAVRLVAIAAVLALLALAAVAVGSSLIDRDPIDLSLVEPIPSADAPRPASPSPAPSVTPSSAPPSATPDAELAGFQPPDPACPAPTEAVAPPAIEIAAGDREIVMQPTITSQLLTTCSTVNPSDFVDAEPSESESVVRGTALDVSVDPGWEILHWQVFDRLRSGEGVNVTPGVSPESPTRLVTVPVPDRAGDVIFGVTLWTRTTDGKVVATISGTVWLEIRDRGAGGFPSAAPGVLTQGLANVGCDSVGWPEDVPEFSTLTFRMDAEAPGYATARSDTGARLEVLWEGDQFQVGSDSVLDADGAVVVENGDAIDVPSDGSLPRLGDYAICLNPQRLIVFVPD